MSSDSLTLPPNLLELLAKETGQDPIELRKLRDQASSSGQSFDRVLLTRGLDETSVLRAFAEDLEMEFLEEFQGVKVPANCRQRAAFLCACPQYGWYVYGWK